MKNLTTITTWMALSLVVAGCTSREKDKTLTADQSTVKTRLEAQMQTAARTKETYHAMDNSALLSKLLEQSKAQREPFNSPAYRELQGRTDVDAKALTALVTDDGNAAGILPLLLLRKLDNPSYLKVPAELRARILTDALQNSKYFNTWGLPNFHLADASQAMLEAGESAKPALQHLLSDTRAAPVFGSQEYMVYKQYNNRVCDYALVFLEQIGGKKDFRLPVSVTERDRLIKEIGAK